MVLIINYSHAVLLLKPLLTLQPQIPTRPKRVKISHVNSDDKSSKGRWTKIFNFECSADLLCPGRVDFLTTVVNYLFVFLGAAVSPSSSTGERMSDHGSLGAASSGSNPDEGKPVMAEWKNLPLVEWDTHQVNVVGGLGLHT